MEEIWTNFNVKDPDRALRRAVNIMAAKRDMKQCELVREILLAALDTAEVAEKQLATAE